MAGQTDQQIIEAVRSATATAIQLVEDEEGWTVVKEQGEAVVKMKINKEGRKVWMCTATVKVDAGVLWDKLISTDDLTSWNTTLTTSRVLKTLSDDIKVTYQVTSEGGGGVVSARDFVYGCRTEVSGSRRIIGGLSVTLEDQPEVKGVVRAIHGPGVQIVEDNGEPGRLVKEIS